MTTEATKLRETIIARLKTLPGYRGPIRRQRVPQIQPADLPQLSVVITAERLNPDGDANAGIPSFKSDITIGITDVRGFATTPELDAQQDDAVDLIETAILCDPAIVSSVEGVASLTRTRTFPQEGETYFAALRLDITFETTVMFEPNIPDDFKGVLVTSRPAGSRGDQPAVTVTIDAPQS